MTDALKIRKAYFTNGNTAQGVVESCWDNKLCRSATMSEVDSGCFMVVTVWFSF